MTQTASKTEAFDLFEEVNRDYLTEARNFAHYYARQKGKVSINDVWDHCPPPVGTSHNALGAIFRGPKWKMVGLEPARRKEARGRRVFLFELAA